MGDHKNVRKNTTFKLNAMKTLVDQAIDNISLETIKDTFEHARQTENEYWINDGLNVSPLVQRMIINLETSSSSMSSSSSSDEN